MAVPTQTIQRLDLGITVTEFSIAGNHKGYIGPRIAAPFPVNAQSADIGRLPIEALMGDEETAHATGANYRRGDFEFEKYAYATEEHGWEEPSPDRLVRVFDGVIDIDQTHAQRAEDKVVSRYERAVQALVQNASAFTPETITHEWNDSANADPQKDVHDAILLFREQTGGLLPNALQIEYEQMQALKRCTAIVDRLKYAGIDDPKDITPAMLAALFDIDMLIVAGLKGGGMRNTANEGQSAAASTIWSREYAAVLRVATSLDPHEVCFARTWMWGAGDVSGLGTDERVAVAVEEYREEQTESTIMRAKSEYDVRTVHETCIVLLDNVIDPTLSPV